MEATMQNYNLYIPQSDIRLFQELAQKMGWKVVKEPTIEVKRSTKSRQEIIDELVGSVSLPEDFDYKKELEKAICERYL